MRLPYWHSFALSLTPKQRLSLERKVYCNTSTDMVLLGVWHQNSGFLLSNNENSPKIALSETGLLQHFYWHGFALTLWMQQNSGFLLSNNENSPQTALWEKGLLQHFYWTAPKLPCERKVYFNTSADMVLLRHWKQQHSGFLFNSKKNSRKTALWNKVLLQHFSIAQQSPER